MGGASDRHGILHVLIPGTITAREAMSRFAATHFKEPLKVAETRTDDSGYARFRLVDGVRWYVCRPVNRGWEIDVEE